MWNSYPKGNEPASGYLVDKDGFNVLLDAGSGVAAHVQQYINIHDIHHIVLTHYHHDHAGDLEAFMHARKIARELKQRNQNLNLYGPESGEVVKFMKRARYSRYHPITDQGRYEIGPLKIDFHRNSHAVETYAVRIMDDTGATMVYTSDSDYLTSLARFSFGADLLITDCSMYEDIHANGHMNAEEAGRLAERSDAQLTLLANLPHHGNLQTLLVKARQYEARDIQLAEAGMVVKL